MALVGADGAGKTTMARRIAGEAPLPLRYLYMGVSRRSSNRMLPTTWLQWQAKRLLGRARAEGGPPDPDRRKRTGSPGLRSQLRYQAKEAVHLLNLLAEEWFRQLLTTYYQLRGYIVIFDRHFFLDYYAHDVDPLEDRRSLFRRLHGVLLQRLLPRPDLVILLDAPAHVLFSRKPEGTVELIERRRQEYWRLKDKVPHFVVVDATKAEDDVAQAIVSCIRAHDAQRTARKQEVITER